MLLLEPVHFLHRLHDIASPVTHYTKSESALYEQYSTRYNLYQDSPKDKYMYISWTKLLHCRQVINRVCVLSCIDCRIQYLTITYTPYTAAHWTWTKKIGVLRDPIAQPVIRESEKFTNITPVVLGNPFSFTLFTCKSCRIKRNTPNSVVVWGWQEWFLIRIMIRRSSFSAPAVQVTPHVAGVDMSYDDGILCLSVHTLEEMAHHDDLARGGQLRAVPSDLTSEGFETVQVNHLKQREHGFRFKTFPSNRIYKENETVGPSADLVRGNSRSTHSTKRSTGTRSAHTSYKQQYWENVLEQEETDLGAPERWREIMLQRLKVLKERSGTSRRRKAADCRHEL